MDYGSMFGQSFEYMKEGVVGKWKNWLMLIIANILILPWLGYALKVLRGEKPAPEVNGWKTLFIDGIKAVIIMLIYFIPVYIVEFLIFGGAIVSYASMPRYGNPMALIAPIGIGIVITLVVYFIIVMFLIIGMIRFARTGNFNEAFNFKGIFATIGKLGWVHYIIALTVLAIFYIVTTICFVLLIITIQFIGILILLCLNAPLALLFARYICILYDSAGAA
jgi:hypothetical protein